MDNLIQVFMSIRIFKKMLGWLNYSSYPRIFELFELFMNIRIIEIIKNSNIEFKF